MFAASFSMVRKFVPVFAAVSALAMSAPALAADPTKPDSYTFGSTVQENATSSHPEKVIFDGSVPCSATDSSGQFAPDNPVHAFRAWNTLSGRSELSLSLPEGNASRRLTGPDFDNLQVAADSMGNTCNPASFQPSDSNDPSFYANLNQGLDSFYVVGGATSPRVLGLAHNEYHGLVGHGVETPDPCPSGIDNKCYLGSITSVESLDGGVTFHYYPAQPSSQAPQLVATIPWKYQPDGGTEGYASPTNIVYQPANGYFYTMFFVKGFRPLVTPQASGACLMRTNTTEPSGWKYYGPDPGDPANPQFAVSPVNPYVSGDTAAARCTKVSGLGGLIPRSLTFNTYFNRYLLVGSIGSDIYYALSKTASADANSASPSQLTDWGPVRLLMRGSDKPSTSENCLGGDPKPAGYPSIIDPNDSSPNFEFSNQTPDLYLTRFPEYVPNPTGTACVPTNNRDLIRVPIRFGSSPDTPGPAGQPPATRFATLEGSTLPNPLTDPLTAFNQIGATGASFTADTNDHYEQGTGTSARAVVPAGSTNGNAFGSLNTAWLPGVGGEGTDIWYGSAFRLNSGFAASNADPPPLGAAPCPHAYNPVWLLRWLTTGSATAWGGIRLACDHGFTVVRGQQTPLSNTEVDPSQHFALPEGSWFWLEVHQRFRNTSGPDPTTGTFPISEVYLNGNRVFSSNAKNTESAATIASLRAGLVTNAAPGSDARVDQTSISMSQRGVPVGALLPPETPVDLNGTGSSGSVSLKWVAPVGGADSYEIHRWDPVTQTWPTRLTTTSTTVSESGLPSGRYYYRINAVKAGVGSPESAPTSSTVP